MEKNNNKTKNILLVFGGASAEHWVSLRSAQTVWQALNEIGYQTYAMGITKQGICLPYFGDMKNITENWEVEARSFMTLQKQKNESLKNAETEKLDVTQPKLNISSFAELISSWYGGVQIDLIFPVLHGANGEDGIFQGLLNFIQWPYVGCDAEASQLGMNKIIAKLMWEKENLPVLPWLSVRKHEYAEFLNSQSDAENQIDFTDEDDEDASVSARKIMSKLDDLLMRIKKELGLPAFIKPVAGGSSIGVTKVDDLASLKEALKTGFSLADQLLIEPFVEAIEYEVGLLGRSTEPNLLLCSEVCEIVKEENTAAYSFAEKYLENVETKVNVPANLTKIETELLHNYAKKAFISLGCRHLSRMDFFKDKKTNKFYLNEINTLPGFTPTSLYAKAFSASGIGLNELVTRLVKMGLEDGFYLKK